MQDLLQSFFLVLPFLYWVTLIFYLLFFLFQRSLYSRFANLFLFVSILWHAGYFALEIDLSGEFLLFGKTKIFSVIAFAIASIYLIIELVTKVKSTGLFFLFLAAILQTTALLSGKNNDNLPDAFKGGALLLHTGSVIIGYTAFFLATIYALLYLILHFNLKKSNFGIFFSRLPPLEVLNSMHNKSVILGLIFVGTAILLGISLKIEKFGYLQLLDPKIIITIVVWFLFLIILIGRVYFRWSKVLLSSYTLIGFLFILASMILLRMVPASFHRFG